MKIYISPYFEYLLMVLILYDPSDVKDLCSAIDNVQHVAGDVDAASVDEVHNEADHGEADIIEDYDWMVSGSSS